MTKQEHRAIQFGATRILTQDTLDEIINEFPSLKEQIIKIAQKTKKCWINIKNESSIGLVIAIEK